MTTTRYGERTTSYPYLMSSKIRIIATNRRRNNKNHDRCGNSDLNGGSINIINDSHEYSESDGGFAPKSRCRTYFNSYFARIIIVILISFTFADMVQAGTCWAKRTQSGKCKHPMERNVSKDKCCGGGEDVGFTEKEMSEFEYFFATALGDGTSCSSCIDSCQTAKCGKFKRCLIRDGQPKCVCAPKCETKNARSKRVNRYVTARSRDNDRGSSEQRSDGAPNRPQQQMNAHGRSQFHNHHHHHHQSIYTDAKTADNTDTSHDVQVLQSVQLMIPSGTKNDKLISIIAPILPSNLSSSHRHKKMQSHHQKTRTTSNSRRKVVKTVHGANANASTVKHSSIVANELQTKHQNGKIHKHIQAPNGSNQYNNGSRLYDNNIVNVNQHRRQTSVEQHLKSQFYGHDIPYPPIDLSLYDNDQFHQAVCGTDGKTYKTECQLKKRACRQKSTSLLVAYKGQCQTSCKHVKCPVGQHCLEDQNLMPHCVSCSITCPPYDPTVKSVIPNPARLVCGVDGNTYRNLCEIKRTACMLGRAIPVAYRGACKEKANCDTVRCRDRQVCLSDLVSHRPRCVSCSFKCPRRKRPQGQQSAFIKICGMNNKSYHSWCHMVRDSCNTGYYIDIKHNGVCQNSTGT